MTRQFITELHNVLLVRIPQTILLSKKEGMVPVQVVKRSTDREVSQVTKTLIDYERLAQAIGLVGWPKLVTTLLLHTRPTFISSSEENTLSNDGTPCLAKQGAKSKLEQLW